MRWRQKLIGYCRSHSAAVTIEVLQMPPATLAWFHDDGLALYPRSLVFEYGNFQTGIKVRWLGDSIDGVLVDLRERIKAAWRAGVG